MGNGIIHNRFCIVSLLFIIAVGCNRNNSGPSYHSFPTGISLSGKTVDTEAVMLRYPFRIKHRDTMAIIMDLHHPDYFYHAFTYPQFGYLASFGKRGQAPGEILSAENFRLTASGMWGLDANRHQLTMMPAGSGFMPANHKVTELDKEMIRALDFALYGDSCFIIPDYSGKHRFHIVGRDGNILSSHGEIPSQTHKKGGMALAQAWRSFIDYNPENHTLAMATQLGEVLEIFNLEKGTHIVKTGPHGEPEYNESDGMAIPSGIMGFSDIQVTNRHIYAVFHGRSFKEIARQGQPPIDGGQYVYVFSLEGEPLCKYTLDRFIYGMDVDEEAGEIYAVDVNSNQPVVKYELKHSTR